MTYEVNLQAVRGRCRICLRLMKMGDYIVALCLPDDANNINARRMPSIVPGGGFAYPACVTDID